MNTALQTSGELCRIDTAAYMDFVSWVDRGQGTTRTYINNLRQFAAYLDYEGITAPQRTDIIKYKNWLSNEHPAITITPEGWVYRYDRDGNARTVTCKPATVANYMQTVKAFFKYLAGAGLYPDITLNVHAPVIDKSAHKKDALQAADVAAIEQSIKEQGTNKKISAGASRKDTDGRVQRADEQGKRLLAMYLLAVNAGLRNVEISRLNCRDFVRKGADACVYIQGKGKAEATAAKPIAPEVADAITDYLSARSVRPTAGGPLFVSTGNRSRGKRIAPTTISTMLKKALTDAGYISDRITPHSCRHSAGNAIMEITGDNIFIAQKYLRHSDPATTEIYTHRRDEKKERRLAADLYAYYHTQENTQENGQETLEGMISQLSPEKREQAKALIATLL